MFLVGIFLFVLPFLAFVAVKRNLRVFLIYSALSIYLFFLFFFIIKFRDFSALWAHAEKPSLKFFLQYYFCFVIVVACMLLNRKICLVKRGEKVSSLPALVMASLAFLLLRLLNWGLASFPLYQPATVVAVLAGGVRGGVNVSIIKNCMISVFLPALTFTLVVSLFSLYLSKKNENSLKLFRVSLKTLLALILLLVSFFTFLHRTMFFRYPALVKEYLKPSVDSDFYRNEYVKPENDKIIFPEKKRNLIFILLESMESSFADKENGGLMGENLIPNLTELAKENVSFGENDLLGGGSQLDGTGWTIAAIVSKLGGVPFNLKTSGNPQAIQSFLPNLITLTDILGNQGYDMEFLFGSDKAFASRGLFFESHGGVKVMDLDSFRQSGRLPSDYHNGFWGFEDFLLYKFAKEELEKLSKGDTPFFLGFLTVDTHYPEGYVCPLCKKRHPENPYKDVITCADFQVATFIDWCKKQDFYEDTLIVVMGDHLFMQVPTDNLFDQSDENGVFTSEHVVEEVKKRKTKKTERRWYNLFVNSSLQVADEKDRVFSSYDMFPTLLEAMGVQVEGHRLGFGTSLFSDEKTLLERFPLDYINEKTMENTIQYDSFVN